jgi:phosphoribosylformylglycinamidine cyclo-ligase
VRTIIVDSTVVSRMKKSEVISNKNIQPGDAIIGLSSFGKTSYENQYNGGMGSNGLTSARHDVFEKYLSVKYPESYDQNILDSLVYSGSKELTSEIKGIPLNAGKLVLSPTRTYAPVIVKILEKHRADINGMVHCSGGAQTKILHFIDQNHVSKDNLFEVPPLFDLIQKESKTPWKEMYNVFNMGHRMEIYTNPSNIRSIVDICNDFNLEAKQIGRVESLKTKKLSIISDKGEFIY